MEKNFKNFDTFEIATINENKKKSWVARLLNIIISIYIIGVLAYLIFCFIFIKAQVIGISMQPLFNSNLEYSIDSADYEKSIYQDIAYVNRFDKGTNGDIILLEILEKENNENNTNIVIKRIIASGGQRVTLLKQEDENVYHYYVSNNENELGTKLDEPYVSESAKELMQEKYFKDFCKGQSSVTTIENGNGAYIVVPQGQIFVLGDNRPISKDSHIFGCVKTEQILGKVSFYYAYNENLFSYLWKQFCSIF